MTFPPLRRAQVSALECRRGGEEMSRQGGRKGSGGQGGCRESGGVKGAVKDPFGIDALTEVEQRQIAQGAVVTEEQLQRVYGLHHPVRHPWKSTSDAAKGGGQRWNPHCFMGLGWKGDKEGGRKRKEKAEAEYESMLVRPKQAPHGGLKNHGATCYLNSMIQCLFFNMPFRKGIMQLSSPADGVPAHVRDSDGFKPIVALQKIFSHLQMSKERAYDPREFIEGLKLSCTVQQDAQEFLKMYLTYIESELLKHSGVPPPLRNLVKDNFSGKYAYCTTCKKCKQKSEIEVPFYDLDLKVQGISRLEESLDDFFKIDILDGDNMYQCSACDKKTEAQRGIELLSLPEVLNLQLLRFVYDVKSNSRKKVSSTINFPKVLNLSKWFKPPDLHVPAVGGDKGQKNATRGRVMPSPAAVGSWEETECVYELEATVMHTGASAVQGHYIAHVKHPVSGNWLRFDDEHVSSLQDDEYFGNKDALAKARKKRKDREVAEMEGRVKSRDAYMLIYRRCDARGLNSCETVEDECQQMIPKELSEEIEVKSRKALEEAKAAEQTSHQAKTAQENKRKIKDDIWDELPDSDFDGYWIGTNWLKHWVSVEPGESVDMIDTGPITSPYRKADPTKVQEMKLVSKKAFDDLCSEYGITAGSERLKRSDLCTKTIEEECRRRTDNKSSKETLDMLKKLLSAKPKVDEDGAVWVSKQWCKDQQSAGKTQDDPAGLDVFCSEQDTCKNASDSTERGLTPETSKRRLVSKDFVDFVKRDFLAEKRPFMIPAAEEPCIFCEARAREQENTLANLKNERNQLKHDHKAVWANTQIRLKSGQAYYIVEDAWVQSFQSYIQVHDVDFSIPKIRNESLLVPNKDKLAVDPGDLTPLDEPKFLWLEESDWMKLKDVFGDKDTVEVKVTPDFDEDKDGLRPVLVNRPAQKSLHAAAQIGLHITVHTEPPMCMTTVEQQREQMDQQRLNFTGHIMRVTRRFPDSSSTAAAVAGGSGSAGTPVGASSRTGRLRKGEVQVTVSSTSTIQSVKLQIYEKLHFSPSEQKLIFEGPGTHGASVELDDGDKTLHDYQVPRDALLVLHILGPEGTEEELLTGSKAREVDAGFSGTLLSGFTERSTAADISKPIYIDVEPSEVKSEETTASLHGMPGAIGATGTVPPPVAPREPEAHSDSAFASVDAKAFHRKRDRQREAEGSEHKKITILDSSPPSGKRQRRPSPPFTGPQKPPPPRTGGAKNAKVKGGRAPAGTSCRVCKQRVCIQRPGCRYAPGPEGDDSPGDLVTL